jgi:hypothetical protein
MWPVNPNSRNEAIVSWVCFFPRTGGCAQKKIVHKFAHGNLSKNGVPFGQTKTVNA